MDPEDFPIGSQERALAALGKIREILPYAVIAARYDPGLGEIKPNYYVEVQP